jgi:Condensin complex protein MksE
MENSFIELKLPDSIRKILNKLVLKGIYISAENERELYNDILRNEEDIRKFLDIFDHKLVVHKKDFIYAEASRNRQLLRGHKELIIFLAVFFERYQKINSSIQAPWYEEIIISTQTLSDINLFSTETAQNRLLSVDLNDDWDIFSKVLKPAAGQFLVQINQADLIHTDNIEAAQKVEFKFNTPVYRFIDMFTELAELFNEESDNKTGEDNA